jgi:hypothetical protein
MCCNPINTQQELAATGRTVRGHIVSNMFTLGSRPGDTGNTALWAPEDMTDYSESQHGTKVASVAGGTTLVSMSSDDRLANVLIFHFQGVASSANLVLIKFRNGIINENSGNMVLPGVTGAALRDACTFYDLFTLW